MPHTETLIYAAGIGVLATAASLAVFNTAMVRSTHALGMMMYGIGAFGVTSVSWSLLGFSFAFAPGNAAWGNLENAGLANLDGAEFPYSAPGFPFSFLTLAIAALGAVALTGAIADRMRFGPLLAFIGIWSLIVPTLTLRWVMPGGWLEQWGVVDAAGGAYLGVAVGASAWGLVLVLGPRHHWRKRRAVPHSRPLALAGALGVWVGWLALAASIGHLTGGDLRTIVIAHLGAVGGAGGWMLLDKRLRGKVTSIGTVSGAMTGLIAVTAGLRAFDAVQALFVGFVAAVVASLASRLKYRLGYDDALDVVAVHLFSGVVGMLLIGVIYGGTMAEGETLGIIHGDGGALFGKQAVAVALIAVLAFVVSVVAAWIVRATLVLRVSPEDESTGIDEAQHGESAYNIRY